MWQKHKTLIVFVGLAGVFWLASYGYGYFQDRKECSTLVKYVPRTDSVECPPNTFCTPQQGEDEHYEYFAIGKETGLRKFKSKEDGVNFCTQDIRQ